VGFFKDIQSAFRKNGAPVSIAIIALSVIGFTIAFAAPSWPIIDNLAYVPEMWASHPWTILTYPFVADPLVNSAFIIVLFECFWMYGIGGIVERELGRIRFIILWLVMTILPALFVWLGLFVLHVQEPLMFLYLPLSAVTVAWAARNPNNQVLFMMVVPITGKWIGWITVGIILFDYGRLHPLLGFFACLHLAVAWAFATNRIPFWQYSSAPLFTRKREGWKPVERNDTYFADVKRREIERAERERLRKLFEGSLSDDPEDKR